MNSLNRLADPFYCMTRLIVGLMFASHGGQLVLGMFGGMPGADNMMMQVGGWIQLVGGLMIAFGLFTRIAAFIASGEMAVAYFMIHVANAPTPMPSFSRSRAPDRKFRTKASWLSSIAGSFCSSCFTAPAVGASIPFSAKLKTRQQPRPLRSARRKIDPPLPWLRRGKHPQFDETRFLCARSDFCRAIAVR